MNGQDLMLGDLVTDHIQPLVKNRTICHSLSGAGSKGFGSARLEAGRNQKVLASVAPTRFEKSSSAEMRLKPRELTQ